jgi:hypothetical protein
MNYDIFLYFELRTISLLLLIMSYKYFLIILIIIELIIINVSILIYMILSAKVEYSTLSLLYYCNRYKQYFVIA